jgi:hypothetical protein
LKRTAVKLQHTDVHIYPYDKIARRERNNDKIT